MEQSVSKKILSFLKRFFHILKPRFSLHYISYTLLFAGIVFSIFNLSQATTPNPGHPWNELGDGVFAVLNNQTAARTYTFPDANATMLTTNALVTVGQGGTGASTLTGVLIGNGTSAVTGLALGAGQSIRMNAGGTAYEAFTAGAGSVSTVSVTTQNGVSATVTNPTTTPALAFTLGAITPTTTNGLTITANGTNTLNIAAGKTLNVLHTLTLDGTDGTTMTFPTTSATIARTDAGQTFTGVNTMTSPIFNTSISTPSIITASGPLGITPTAGSNLNINLSTTGDFAVNTNQLYVDTSTGSVGIGTTSPVNKLEVSGAINDYALRLSQAAVGYGSGWTGINIGGADIVSGEAARLNFKALSSGGNNNSIARISALTESRDTSYALGALAFYTHPGTGGVDTPTEKMRITSAGNVGIGVTNPTSLFSVGSTNQFQINSSGAITTTGSYTQTGANTNTFSGTTTFSGIASTSAGGAGGVGTNLLASTNYIQSRGENLITNGSGLLGNNYNFTNFTFDSAETHGGGGSFKINVAQQAAYSDELIPVDITKRYRQVVWVKSGDVGGANYTAANSQYIGVVNYDIDGNNVGAENSTKQPGSTDTTLAVQLNPGDSTMTVNNASGWYNSTAASSRQFSWYGYTNSKGYTYPDYTYTRNISGNYSSNGSLGAWSNGGISGNVITLRVPWAGPTIPAGAAVRNSPYGGTFKYITLVAQAIPNSWTRYEGYIGSPAGDFLDRENDFRMGTAYVKMLFLVNYQGAANNNVRYSDLWFSEASAQNLELASATQQGIISLANQSLGSGNKFFGGKVGVGLTNPTASLHLTSGTATAGTAPLKFTSGTVLGTTEAGAVEYDGNHLYFTAANAGTRYQLDQQTGLGGGFIPYTGGTSNVDLGIHNLTVDTNSLFVDATNHRVGIGTTNPGQKLTVTGGNIQMTDANAKLYLTDGSHYISYDGSNTQIFSSSGGVSLAVNSASPISFVTNSVNQMRLSATGGLSLGSTYYSSDAGAGNMIVQGNVGIGTTNPGVKLQVAGTIQTNANVYSPAFNYDGGVTFQNGTAGDLLINENNAGNIILQTTATERMRILANGNVGIGTTNPTDKLQIGDYSGQFALRVAGSSGTDGSPILNFYRNGVGTWTQSVNTSNTFLLSTGSDYTDATLNSVAKLAIQANGNVGIGTTNPTALLQLSTGSPTTAAYGIQFGTNAATNLYASATNIIKTDGWLYGASGLIGNAVQFNEMYPLGQGTNLTIRTRGNSANTDAIVFKTGATVPVEVMRIDYLGNVGIGTTNPTGLLTVNQTSTDTTTPLFLGTATWNNAATDFMGFKVNIVRTAASNNSKLFSLQASGTPIYEVDRDGRMQLLGQNGNSLWVSTAPYAGTYPLFQLGTVASNAGFSTSGTYIGINAANGYAGDLANLMVNGASQFLVKGNGKIGIGLTNPTAVLNLKAGSATAGTAPLKFTSGTVLGTTEAGAVEYDGTHLYFTAANAGSRYQLDQQAGTGANALGTYITQTATNAPANAQILASLGTGIVKNTTTTGVLSIAVAGDFPTLNQNTTGSAATLTTARTINGVSFNGSANITVPSDIAAGTTGNLMISNGTIWTSAAVPTWNQNTTGSAATLTTARTIAGTSFNGSANIALANKFIVQGTADAGLSGAQFLGALGTGIVKNTTTTGVLTIATGGDLPAMTATVGGAVPTPPNNTTTFLRGDGTFASIPAGGDMYLANVQTVTGAKTFNDTKLLLRNVANTFNGSFTNTNTADRVYTLKDASGTLAFTSDIPAVTGYIPYTGGTSNVDLGIHNLTVDTNSLFVDATNHKVGIETTSPLGQLQIVTTNDTAPTSVSTWDTRHFVVGQSGNTGGVGISYNSTNNYGVIDALSPNTAWRNLILQSGGGFVGIGTTNPTKLLSVYNDQNAVDETGAAAVFGNTTTAKTYGYITASQANNSVTIAGILSGTNNNTKLLLNPAGGAVGIGMTNPVAKLDVAGNVAITYNSSFSSYNSVGTASPLLSMTTGTVIGANTIVMPNSGNGYEIGTSTTAALVVKTNSVNTLNFYSGGSEKMSLIANGNLGIGTTAPIQKLDVNGNIRSNDISLRYGSRYITVEGAPSPGGGDGETLDISAGNGAAYSLYDAYPGGVLTLRGGSANYNGYASAYANGGDVKITGGDGVGTTSGQGNGGNIFIYGGNHDTGGIYGNVILANNGSSSVGRVGIGTTNPLSKLDMESTAYTNYSQRVLSGITADPEYGIGSSDTALYTDLNNSGVGAVYLSSFAEGSGQLYGVSSTDKNASNIFTGNVNIGATLSKNINFSVNQGTAGMGTVSNTASGTTVTGTNTQFTNTFKIGDTITIGGQTVAISSITSDTSMTTATITSAHTDSAYTLTGGTIFNVLGNGKVGIGTSTPDKKLTIIGDTRFANNGADYIRATTVSSMNVLNLGYDIGSGGTYLNMNGNTHAVSMNGLHTEIGDIEDLDSGVYIDLDSGAGTIDLGKTATSIIRIAANNNVGIGTTNPTQALDVVGSIRTSNAIAAWGDIQTGDIDSVNTYAWNAICVNNNSGSCNSTAGVVLGLANTGAATNIPTTGDTFFNNGGNVGIGMTNPTASLNLRAGTATAGTAPLKFTSGTLLGTTEAGTVEFSASHLYFTAANGGTRYQLDQQSVGGGSQTPWTSNINATGYTLQGNSTASGNLWLDSTSSGTKGNVLINPTGGNVGIGTTNPNALLNTLGGDVRFSGSLASNALFAINDGAAGNFGILYNASNQTSNGSIYLLNYINSTGVTNLGRGGQKVAISNTTTPTMSTGTALYVDGNVGIGTTNPGATLETSSPFTTISGDMAGVTQVNAAIMSNDTAATDKGGTLGLGGLYSGTSKLLFGAIRGAKDTTNSGYLSLYSYKAAVGLTEGLRLTSAGNVGIGITNPAKVLDVNGEGYFRGTGSFIGGSTAAVNSGYFQGGFGGGTAVVQISTANGSGAPAIDLTGSDATHQSTIRSLYGMQFSTQNNGSIALMPNGTGNVGIGTTAPLQKLDVSGTSLFEGNMLVLGSGSYGAQAGTGAIRITNNQNIGWRNAANSADLTLGVNAQDQFNIMGGNVGIGTTAPRNILQIEKSSTNTTLDNQNTEFLLVRNTSVTANTKFGLIFGLNDTYPRIAGVIAEGDYQGNAEASLLFATRNLAGTFAERMRINSEGNLGIGTTAPRNKLEILSTSAANGPFLTLTNQPTTAGSYSTGIDFRANDTASANYSFSSGRIYSIIDAGGYNQTRITLANATAENTFSDTMTLKAGLVGIGTTAPARLLDVYDSSSNSYGAQIRNAASTLAFYNGSNGIVGSHIMTTTNNALGFATNSGADQMVLLTSGNLGIGMTNPTAKLDVLGSGNTNATYALQINNSDSSRYFKFRNDGYAFLKGNLSLGAVNNSIYFKDVTSGLEISSYNLAETVGTSIALNPTAGNVGIGLSNPSFKLHIKPTVVNTESMTLGGSTTGGFALTSQDGGAYGLFAGVGGSGNGWIQAGRYDSATAYNLVLQAAGGSVGIGTISPGTKLDVLGSIRSTQTTGSSYSQFTHANAGGNASYPRSLFQIFGATESNVGLYVSPGNATGTTQIPAFMGVSTNASSTAASSVQLVSAISTTSAGIYTLAAEAAYRAVPIYFGAPTSPDLAILTNGNIGIANTNPGALLDIGTAGTALGTLRLEGNTSGYFQMQSAAAAGSITMVMPATAGTTGFQLSTTVAGSVATTSWTAAGSLREWKENIVPFEDADTALNQILSTPIYHFNYKKGMGTGDSDTSYVGVMADEAPWAMHYSGKIINPVNTLGYMVLGMQATNKKISDLTDIVTKNATTQSSVNETLLTSIQDLNLQISNLEKGQVVSPTTTLTQDMAYFFSDVIVKVENGVAYMKALAVDTLKIGSPDKRTGITLYDEVSGEPYCISVASGATKTTQGECVVITPPASTIVEGPIAPATIAEGVNVLTSPDTVAPTITLNGVDSIDLLVGGTYSEEGALAIDNMDKDVAIIISGSVDTAVAGVYTITYSAKDTAGNTAAPVTRTIKVSSAPIDASTSTTTNS